MLNIHGMVVEYFINEIGREYERMYGILEPSYKGIIEWIGHLALENMANSDTVYHDMHHVIMVTLAGERILVGKHLLEGGVSPKDWLHFMLGLLCHDIGYVKGICRGDNADTVATGIDDNYVPFPEGATNAALTPYHVDRGKLFIHERFGRHNIIEADLVASYIEMTRFPPPNDEDYKDTSGYAELVRAADLIGQLGDPDYLRKLPALFYEFEELGVNTKLGYKNPGDMRRGYAKFYWGVISPYIQDATKYLQVTQEGRHWLTNLHSQVFIIEHATDQA